MHFYKLSLFNSFYGSVKCSVSLSCPDVFALPCALGQIIDRQIDREMSTTITPTVDSTPLTGHSLDVSHRGPPGHHAQSIFNPSHS